MSVHAPGRVNRGGPGHRRGGLGRAIARALPSSAPLGAARKKLLASVSMTSMIDVLVVLTVFLLITFQASMDCGVTGELARVPDATSITDLIDAPMVHVGAGSAMVLDGVVVASSDELASAGGRVVRIEGLKGSSTSSVTGASSQGSSSRAGPRPPTWSSPSTGTCRRRS